MNCHIAVPVYSRYTAIILLIGAMAVGLVSLGKAEVHASIESFEKEPLKIMKKHLIEHSPFRMTLTVNPCHGRDNNS